MVTKYMPPSAIATPGPKLLAKYEPVIGLEVHVQLATAHQDFLRLPAPVSARRRTPMSARSAWDCPARCRC